MVKELSKEMMFQGEEGLPLKEITKLKFDAMCQIHTKKLHIRNDASIMRPNWMLRKRVLEKMMKEDEVMRNKRKVKRKNHQVMKN